MTESNNICIETGNIKFPRAGAQFRGTPRYAPLNAHLSQELGRKDDLETWLYMLIEMTSGHLPWTNEIDKAKVCVLITRKCYM